MYRKTVSGIVLMLLLTSMLSPAFNIQPVKSEPTTWTATPYIAIDVTRLHSYTPSFSLAIDALGAEGYTVHVWWSGEITADRLAGYSVLIITLPQAVYSPSEVAAILDFVESGHGLLFLGEYGKTWFNLSDGVYPAGADPVLDPFGISINNDCLYDPTDYGPGIGHPLIDTFPVAHPVTEGIGIYMPAGTATLVVESPGKVIVTGDDDTYAVDPVEIDPEGDSPSIVDGMGGSYEPVMAASFYGVGRAVVAGDHNWITDQYGDYHDNLPLLVNIVEWLFQPEAHACKILPVPYYSQGDTDWCVPTSMSMIFKYYNVSIHSWDIAKDWGWNRDIELWEFWDNWDMMRWNVESYFEEHGFGEEDVEEISIDFETVCLSIENNVPVLLSLAFPIRHAVVVIGCNRSDGTVYVNDPSGALIEEISGPSSSSLIAVELNWACIPIPLLSWAIAVDGIRHPPEGTIDVYGGGTIFNKAARFFSPRGQVYSWYDSDHGLIWENTPNRALALHADDKFHVAVDIFNHMNDDRNYILQIDFKFCVPGVGCVYVDEPIQLPVSVPSHDHTYKSWLSPPLRDFFGDYGIYDVTLRLFDEDRECVYDEIEFPGIVYDPLFQVSLGSPADLYVTDPNGLHVGVDRSMGEVVNEIPGAVYAGPGSQPEIVLIPDPLDGAYEVQLIGTGTGDYSLTTELVTLEQTATQTYTGKIVEDAIYVYTVTTNEEAMTASPDPVAETEHFQEFITNLPDDAFVTDDPNEFAEFKKEIFDKINETREELEEDRYMESIAKLNDMKEEVIAEAKLQATTKSELCTIIEHIISGIETLEQE